MNKNKLISFIKKEQKEKNKKQILSACKAYDYLKQHKHKKYKDGKQSYIINNHICFCTYMDLQYGILEFMALDYTANIGTEYAGETLRIEF